MNGEQEQDLLEEYYGKIAEEMERKRTITNNVIPECFDGPDFEQKWAAWNNPEAKDLVTHILSKIPSRAVCVHSFGYFFDSANLDYNTIPDFYVENVEPALQEVNRCLALLKETASDKPLLDVSHVIESLLFVYQSFCKDHLATRYDLITKKYKLLCRLNDLRIVLCTVFGKTFSCCDVAIKEQSNIHLWMYKSTAKCKTCGDIHILSPMIYSLTCVHKFCARCPSSGYGNIIDLDGEPFRPKYCGKCQKHFNYMLVADDAMLYFCYNKSGKFSTNVFSEM